MRSHRGAANESERGESDLGSDAEVDLKPLGRCLVLGTPAARLVDVEPCKALVAPGVPVGGHRRRRRDLPVSNVAAHHAQRHATLTRCTTDTHTTPSVQH